MTTGATDPTQPVRGTSAWRKALAAVGWTLTALYFLVAALILGLRYWVLPDLDRHSTRIERAVSDVIGKRVSIGRVQARWPGLHPELELSDVRIFDDEGRVALSLPLVEAVIGWRSLPLMSLRLHSLAFERPNLDIRRDRSGRVYVAGLELEAGRGGGTGLAAWVLSQSEIVIRDAHITWKDEMRAAPTLELVAVNFVLHNRGRRHRLGLKAQTHRDFASGLDVRAELRGRSLDDPESWTGLVFAQLDHVDLAAWKRWFDYPFEIESGKGALRVWVAFDGRRVTEATADVALADVRARLARDLPMLDLEYLNGRLGGGDAGGTVDVQARRLALKTRTGMALPPADLVLHWERGTGGHEGGGVLQAASLEIEPLVTLAEYLPLPSGVRRALASHRPRGALHDLRLTWTGEPDRPRRYSVRARFSSLGLQRHASWPGFAGLSGSIEASERSGSVHVEASAKVTVDLPLALAEERVELDGISGQFSWTRPGGHLQLRLANVSLSNQDFAATVRGTYSTRSRTRDGEGTVDIEATVERLEARTAWRYIPFLPPEMQEYLKTSALAGRISEGRVELKGDLADFPFRDARSGVFRVTARISDGELHYADGWPALSGIAATLRLDGPRLDAVASRSSILGARVSGLRVHVPDLYDDKLLVRLDGEAQGPVAEFVRFVRTSPLQADMGSFTRTIVATGNGRLQLRLNLPVTSPAPARFSGSFDFSGSRISVDESLPALTEASGRIEFTEGSFAVRQLAARFLGGPATFSLQQTGKDAYTLTGQGTASIEELRRRFDTPLLAKASGSAPWRGSLAVSGDDVELLVESPLTGVALDLPPPFAKSPDDVLPVRMARTTRSNAGFLKQANIQRLPAGGDAVALTVGRLLDAVFVRRQAEGGHVIEHGAVGINRPAPAVAGEGVVVAGRLAHVDVDRWRTLLGGDSEAGGTPVRRVEMAIEALDVAGKRLNDVNVRAVPADGGWHADVNARELGGSVHWHSEGRGRIVARLEHLTLPDDGPSAAPQESAGSELPAVDIVADAFTVRDTALGRLELVAVNETRDWRIERLSLVSADSTFTASGVWQSWASRPSISLDIDLDVRDAGVFLTRMGYPDTVRGGTARLKGKVGWVGSPQSIDYPTLTGHLALTAAKGQFLKTEPGIAKLLGILSLQSWITLDFRDLFGEGFAFERISATANIARGIMHTGDFVMSGKSAQVSMTGSVDLARETQKLRVRVVPSVGDSVSSVAGLILANPVAGIGAMVAQRLLKDPLGRIFAYEYAVTGSWSEPVVENLYTAGPVEGQGR